MTTTIAIILVVIGMFGAWWYGYDTGYTKGRTEERKRFGVGADKEKIAQQKRSQTINIKKEYERRKSRNNNLFKKRY